MTETRPHIRDFAAMVRLTTTLEPTLREDVADDWKRTAFRWRCILSTEGMGRGPGRAIAFPYFMGRGHIDPKTKCPKRPNAATILESLALDASAGHQTFADWCADFGSDPDSISARETYEACRKIADDLRYLFADDYAALIEADRD